MASSPSAIEIRGAASGLLDDPLLLRARGAGGAEAQPLLWRARFRDDDGRVWQASAAGAEQLGDAWRPAKATTGALAALQSLRPVSLDVNVEAPDGRGARRTFTRALAGEGVRTRRWREPALVATLSLPAGAPCATVVIDATTGPRAASVAALAAPLLASRGVLVLVVPPPREGAPAAEALRVAAGRVAAVPGATDEVTVLPVLDPFEAPPAPVQDATTDPFVAPPVPEHDPAVVLPPGVAVRDADGVTDAPTRAAAWDALLARLGAQPRTLQ